MKCVFWAPVHGQPGTTTNMLIASLITGIYFRKKGIITQTHFNYNNLEAPLIEANSDNQNYRKYFSEIGIDVLARNFKAEKMTKEWLDYCCAEIPNTNMVLLPGTTQTNREFFDHEMNQVLVPLLRAIEEYYGIIFADASSGNNPISMKLINDADIVVVNLCQNMNIVNMFFDQYKDILSEKKVFYLLGNYDYRSKYNIVNIRFKHLKYIQKSNSGVIPYNTNFRDSQTDGKVVEFLKQNINCKRSDTNYYFIEKSIKATEKILKMAGVTVERK